MRSTQSNNLRKISENREIIKKFDGQKILLFSPNLQDLVFWHCLLPKAHFSISTLEDWNIETSFFDSPAAKKYPFKFHESKNKLFDLAIAQNVFMYVKNPTQAAKYISSICDNLLIQDIKYRKRSNCETGLGNDGDVSRYAAKEQEGFPVNPWVVSEIFSSFSVLYQFEYRGRRNEFHMQNDFPIHIVALLNLNKRNYYEEISRDSSKQSISKILIRYLKRNKRIV